MQRLEYFDKLKGMAILLVVMGHLAEHSINIVGSPFNALYASFHMPLFMFLSGVFAYRSFTSYSAVEVGLWMKKKLI